MGAAELADEKKLLLAALVHAQLVPLLARHARRLMSSGCGLDGSPAQMRYLQILGACLQTPRGTREEDIVEVTALAAELLAPLADFQSMARFLKLPDQMRHWTDGQRIGATAEAMQQLANLVELLHAANDLAQPDCTPLLQLPQLLRICVAAACLQVIALVHRAPTTSTASMLRDVAVVRMCTPANADLLEALLMSGVLKALTPLMDVAMKIEYIRVTEGLDCVVHQQRWHKLPELLLLAADCASVMAQLVGANLEPGAQLQDAVDADVLEGLQRSGWLRDLCAQDGVPVPELDCARFKMMLSLWLFESGWHALDASWADAMRTSLQLIPEPTNDAVRAHLLRGDPSATIQGWLDSLHPFRDFVLDALPVIADAPDPEGLEDENDISVPLQTYPRPQPAAEPAGRATGAAVSAPAAAAAAVAAGGAPGAGGGAAPGGRGTGSGRGVVQPQQQRAALAPTPSCAVCGVSDAQLRQRGEPPSVKLRKCGACSSVMYCSAGCQKQDWARHKGECNKK